MKSHFALNGGVAAACAVAGASSLLMDGNCSGQAFIAADYATNSTYASGWSAGQNGGYGFGPWSMNYTGGTTATNVSQNAMDHTSPYDPFGVAWTLFNLAGTTPSPTSSPDRCVSPPTGTDISRAGRAFPNGGLQPGQTFSTVIANPSCRTFWRGYTIILSNGADNIQYGGVGTMLGVGCFDYFSYGKWYTTGTWDTGRTPILDTDTTTNGMRIDISVTSTNTYHLVMTPLGNPAIAYSEDGIFATNGPISWVTYQLYNTDSNFYPTNAPCGPDRTDFYIQSMTVSGLTLNILRDGSNVVLYWPTNYASFTLDSSLDLGTSASWNAVTTAPVVLNAQFFVTNPITGTRQYFRLQQ